MNTALFEQIKKRASYSGTGNSTSGSAGSCNWAIVQRGPIMYATVLFGVTGSMSSNCIFTGLIPAELSPNGELWAWAILNTGNKTLHPVRFSDTNVAVFRRDVTASGMITTNNFAGTEELTSQFIYLRR